MVAIKYEGRFGNNLFQFAAAKFIADKMGLNISNPLATKILPHENIFSPDTGDDVNLNGFFQSQEVVRNFSSLPFLKIENREGLFVHVRLGDLLQPHSQNGDRFMSQDYYERAIGGSIGGYVSSDSPDHPIVKGLIEKYNLQLFNDSPENTIIFAAGCSKKVLSLGTFSWWIGYLGNQNEVICPDSRNCVVWHGNIFPQQGWNIC